MKFLSQLKSICMLKWKWKIPSDNNARIYCSRAYIHTYVESCRFDDTLLSKQYRNLPSTKHAIFSSSQNYNCKENLFRGTSMGDGKTIRIVRETSSLSIVSWTSSARVVFQRRKGLFKVFIKLEQIIPAESVMMKNLALMIMNHELCKLWIQLHQICRNSSSWNWTPQVEVFPTTKLFLENINPPDDVTAWNIWSDVLSLILLRFFISTGRNF